MSTPWQPMLTALMTERYGAFVARTRVLGVPPHEVDDLIQAALIKTFAKPRALKGLPQAEAYVKRVIVSEFLDERRRRSAETERWERATAASADAVPNPANSVERHVDIEHALADLSPRERACITLRYLDDLTLDATASALGLSLGAVKRYVHDGLAKLNTILGTNTTIDEPPLAPVNSMERRTR